MDKSEIKQGMKVCIYFKNAPFCNTTVKRYPSRKGDVYADLDGIDDPFPIADLRPFNDGTINPYSNGK
jgi:hypothetical protein